jgi:hypothetical protein
MLNTLVHIYPIHKGSQWAVLNATVVHGPQQPLAYNESVDEGVMDNPWI